MAEAGRRHGGGRPLPPPPPSRGVNQPSLQRIDPVDREKTCPMLLRVFTKVGGHHTKEDYAVRGKEPKDSFTCKGFLHAGQTFSYPNRKQAEDSKTLSDLGFEIGDYLGVAIY